MIGRILSKIEVWFVLRMIRILAKGCYYFRHANSRDLEKYLKVEEVEDEFDGLVYRKIVKGTYANKLVRLYTWSCGISIVRCWIEWV